MKEEARPFFVMPGSALLDLREELELIEDKEAGETLARYGYRAGVGLINSLGIHALSMEELVDSLPQIWMETGLSRLIVEEASEEGMTIKLDESLEAGHGRRCDFARGYLSGIVSTIAGRRYDATEVECRSEGREMCKHHLVLADTQFPSVETKTGDLKYNLEPGYSYIIESEDPYAGFDVFVDYLSHGARGLCIVREYPEKLKKRFALSPSSYLWLSYERDIKYAREPTNIPLIYSEVKTFLDSAKGGIVLISGIEYMISQSSFDRVLKFVQLLNENVAVKDATLLLTLSPLAIDTREVKMLERELRVFSPS